jgi:hypothetical protein
VPSASNNSTSTTTAGGEVTGTTVPTFVLSLEGLTSDTTLYSVPELSEDPEAAPGGLASPPTTPVGQANREGGLSLAGPGPVATLPGAQIGLWVGWLLLIVGAAVGAITFDEIRRRRRG